MNAEIDPEKLEELLQIERDRAKVEIANRLQQGMQP